MMDFDGLGHVLVFWFVVILFAGGAGTVLLLWMFGAF